MYIVQILSGILWNNAVFQSLYLFSRGLHRDVVYLG
jgi:hypothetical protein